MEFWNPPTCLKKMGEGYDSKVGYILLNANVGTSVGLPFNLIFEEIGWDIEADLGQVMEINKKAFTSE
nr:hypothetical protein CFP56_24734 [Quercus suber]